MKNINLKQYKTIVILTIVAGFLLSASAYSEGVPKPYTPSDKISPDVRKMIVEQYDMEDIKDQTIGAIEKGQTIDKSFSAAKEISIPQPALEVVREENTQIIMTPSQIINSVLAPDAVDKKIDLDFDDGTLSDICLTLGAAGGMNILLDPSLKGNRLDLHLKSVSIEEALLLISNSNGLGFKRIGNSLYITTADKLRDQNMVSKVIKLKNIDAQEAKSLIKDLAPTINVSEGLNSLMVIGQVEDIIKIEETIKNIDRPQPQVLLEANIIEVNKDALKDLGVDWSDQLNIGYQESNRPVTFANVEDAPGNAIKVFSFARNPLQFITLIKMLENQNKAKVLSNPRVTTMNNKEAEIFVGDRIPYTVTTISGGVATSDVRFEEPGIRLKITPSIINEDSVVIKVEPEVSFIFAFRGPNDQYPQTKKRQATAYVRIKNNQPFVLGGLLNQEDKKNLYKVPMLGNVPWLGNLFSYEKHTLLDTELIITITPTIVYGDM